jgi:conjugal transfer/entry exclusion protein
MKKSVVLAVMVAAIISKSASAVDVVFDPTNLIQNWTTALATVAVEARQASQYALQYQQYLAEARQLQSAATGAFKEQFGEVAEAYGVFRQYQGELERLQGDLAGVKSIWENRQRLMAASGLSWDQWMKRENESLKYRRDSAGLLSMQERQAMDNVARRWAVIQKIQDKIPNSAGVHESTQLLNTQMNTLTAQMQDLIALNAGQGQQLAQQAGEQVIKDQRAADAAAELEALRRQRRQADLDLIDSLAKQPDPLKARK